MFVDFKTIKFKNILSYRKQFYRTGFSFWFEFD